jgi:hypothetical protein
MTDIATEFLFSMTAVMGEPVLIGATPYGQVAFHHAVSGRVEGPRIRGDILPVGGDRALLRADGAVEINVQVLIKTDDGQTIYMNYRGLIVGPLPDVSGQEELDPKARYWRIAPMFETAAENYRWLNQILGVGIGRVEPGQVAYDIYALR